MPDNYTAFSMALARSLDHQLNDHGIIAAIQIDYTPGSQRIVTSLT